MITTQTPASLFTSLYNTNLMYHLRQDCLILGAWVNSAGALQVTVNANMFAELAVGAQVFIGDSVAVVGPWDGVTITGNYEELPGFGGLFTVASCTNVANSVITFQAGSYALAGGTLTGGYLNNLTRYNYKLKMTINVPPYAGAGFTSKVTDLYFSCKTTGIINTDTTVLRDLVQSKVVQDAIRGGATDTYWSRVFSNTNASIKYQMVFEEQYTIAGAQSNVAAGTLSNYYKFNSARQIIEHVGTNMTDKLQTIGQVNRGWLTKFTSPTLWQGLKNIISYIDNNISLVERTLVKKKRYLVNGTYWGAFYELRDYAYNNTDTVVQDVFEDVKASVVIPYDKELPSGPPGVSGTVPNSWVADYGAIATTDQYWDSIYVPTLGLYIACSFSASSGTQIVTSPDALTWTTRTPSDNKSWYGLAFGNGIVVCTTDAVSPNRVMTSTDGITWTGRGATTTGRGVAFGAGKFVIPGINIVYTSTDGITWSSTVTTMNQTIYGLNYANGTFVACANGGNIWTSVDGLVWTQRTSNSRAWSKPAFGNGVWVTVAAGLVNVAAYSSDNGVTWNESSLPATNGWISIAFGNGSFVAISQSLAGTVSAYSSNGGVSWTGLNSITTNSWSTITFGNDKFVAFKGSSVSASKITRLDVVTGITWGTINMCPPILLNQSTEVITFGLSSKYRIFPFESVVGSTYNINVSGTTSGTADGNSPNDFYVQAVIIDILGNIITVPLNSSLRPTGSFNINFNLTGIYSKGSFIGIAVISNRSVQPLTCILNPITVLNCPTVNKQTWEVVTLSALLNNVTVENILSSVLTLAIRTPLDQYKQLFWTNSLGGMSSWCFEYSQLRAQKFTDTKNKRFTLYALRVTDDELEALDELNSLGNEYNPTILDLNYNGSWAASGLAGFDVTSKRNGVQVYTDNFEGAIVIPTEWQTKTVQTLNNLQIVIETTDIFHQL